MITPNPVPRRNERFGALGRLSVFAALVAVALVAATIGTAAAQPTRNDVRDRTAQDVRPQPGPDVVRDQPVPDVEQLRLVCAPDVVGDQRGVLCRWSPTTQHVARGYQLYRIVNGSARQLLTTVGTDGRLAYLDADVSAPSRLVYGVVALNSAGRIVGIGGPVDVTLGDRIEELRLACAPDSIGDQRGVLCRWSETMRRDVRGYLLYRVVGSDAREVVARFGLDGRRAYFDRDITRGTIHVYYVAAVDANGNVVASGGPVRVQWPDARPTD